MSDYTTLNAIAYGHLRRMIYAGELQFGMVYSETKLASRLSISRTPIRDALNRLAQERYIDILPNRGFMLHTPTQADIIEAFHVRLMAEGYCANLVAEHYPDAAARAAIERMEDALDRQHHLMEDDSAYSLSQFWLDDLAFHKAPLDYVNIPSLALQYERFMYVFMPHHLIGKADDRRKQPPAMERHLSTLTEHAAITEALKSHDAGRVQAVIRTHIDSSLKALYARLED